MTDPTKLLFGIDTSDFSRNALGALGKFTAGNKAVHIQIFHGAPDLSVIGAKYPFFEPQPREETLRRLNAESKKCLEKAKTALIEAGIDEDSVSVVLKENCTDPADAIQDLAEAEGSDSIGVARFGESTIGRHVIGSVTSRIASSSEKFPVWIVDHRVKARHVLVCLVGAPIGERIMDHAAHHFSHLHDIRFTLFHVIPPVTLEADRLSQVLSKDAPEQEKKRVTESMTLQLQMAEKALEEGKQKFLQYGIPEKNIHLKKQAQEEGIARDILTEMERGDNGILVVGRKGSKEIQQYSLGSKAYKLLCASRPFMLCLVN